MPKMDRNYFTFLGGEVSKNLFNRIDMQQNGKWFETAKNIYFDNTGGFLNRHGFKRIGFSINNQEGSNIKLIPFVFNRNSSYCIELGTTYFRILKNGKFLTKKIYEDESGESGESNYREEIIRVEHDIPLESTEDISYAQIADVLYLTVGGTTKIKTISRYAEDDWRFADFDYEIPPMTSFNTDKTKTLSFSSYSTIYPNYYFKLSVPTPGSPIGFVDRVGTTIITLRNINGDDEIVYQRIGAIDITNMISDFNLNQLGNHNLVCTQDGSNYIKIEFPSTSEGVIDAEFYETASVTFTYNNSITYVEEYFVSSSKKTPQTISLEKEKYNVVSQNHLFFLDKGVNDVFCVKNIYSPSPNGERGKNKTYSVNNLNGNQQNVYTDAFWSNGNWRIVTSGNFDGQIEMQYSYDGNVWYTHRTFTSSMRVENNITYSQNYNEYGTLEVDDNILLRLKLNCSCSNVGIVFDTGSFENISYYKILSKTSESSALVQCLKYSIGTPKISYEWAEAAWSDANGYPKIVFTYQNRLGFASTTNEPQTLWFSKTNDFKRFDVNVKVRDTDPITISALKPKGISDIVNVQSAKKLFVFTSDYEFAIKDEGALTQKNKELVNFTSYGSDTPETQVAANRVLFVERGGKAARELVYDIMQENYEARDVTMHFKHLFSNGNRIKSTSYVSDEYKMYLMLTEDGTLICYKYIPEQEIMACSKFVHSAGKITNVLCINGEGSTQNIYIAVDIDGYKYIEILMAGESAAYIDSYEDVTLDEVSDRYQTDYFEGRDLLVVDDDGIHKVKVGTDGIIVLPKELLSFSIGFPLDAEATLIPPSVMFRDGSSTIYNKKNLYKSHITFQNSYGFLVGIKGREKFKQVYKIDKNSDIDDEITITSGTKDVVIPSSYTDENMLSFIQREPYQMYITNTELEVDYGGK